MTTKLPALVPFNDPVTVCAECLCASCAQGRHRCEAAKLGRATLKSEALFMLRALAKENPSYWRGAADRDNDMPIDVQDLHEMARYMRKTYTEPGGRGMALGYLVDYLRIDPDQVAEAMAKEWPDVGGAT